MKLSKIAGASLLTLGLAILPATLPAGATDATGSNTNTGTAMNNGADNTDHGYNDGDWGLLGLLGLFGLFGRRSRSTEPTAYQDPSVTTSQTGSDRY